MRQRSTRGLVPNTAGPLLFVGEDLPAQRCRNPYVFRVKGEILQEPNLTASGDKYPQFPIFHTTMVTGRCSNSASNLRYSNRFHSSYSLRCKHLINPTSHRLAAAKTSWKFSIRPLILQHISRLWNGFDLTVFASDPTVRWKMMEDANLFIAYQKNRPKHGVNLSSPAPSSPSHLTPT